MSKKEQTREQKLPRTVQVRLLVPYAALAVLFVLVAGLITGWFVHNDYQQSMTQQFVNGVASVQVKK